MIDYVAQDKILNRMSNVLDRDIARAYATSLGNIRTEVRYYADRYAESGKLTYANMTKYKRLQNLEKDVRTELLSLNSEFEKILNNGTSAQYFDAYFRTGFGIESEVNAKLSYTMLQKNAIKESITNPFKELALQRNRELVIDNIRREITQGLVQGSSYSDISYRIKTALGKNTNNAMTIARTETHRVVQLGRLDSAQHAENVGVKIIKVWTSSLDADTRDTHAALDGQEREMDEDFTSPSGDTASVPGQFGAAEENINCRCSLRTQVKGFAPEFRRTREDGVIPFTKYEDWAKDKGISNPYWD